MKKMIKSLMILVLLVSLSGCKFIIKEKEVHTPKGLNSSDRFYMVIKDETLTNGGFNYEIHNNTKLNIMYGDPYYIQKSEVNGWEDLKPKEEMVFNLPAFVVESGTFENETIDWTYHYGKLEPGKYRFYKEILENDNAKGTEIYVEFEIK